MLFRYEDPATQLEGGVFISFWCGKTAVMPGD